MAIVVHVTVGCAGGRRSTIGSARMERLTKVYATISAVSGTCERSAARRDPKIWWALTSASYTAMMWPTTIDVTAAYQAKRAPTTAMLTRYPAVPKRSQPYPNGSEASGTTYCPWVSR